VSCDVSMVCCALDVFDVSMRLCKYKQYIKIHKDKSEIMYMHEVATWNNLLKNGGGEGKGVAYCAPHRKLSWLKIQYFLIQNKRIFFKKEKNS
jgi:hypothetical protein